MDLRLGRRFRPAGIAAALALVCATVVIGAAGTSSDAASGRPGYCPGKSGVTVVVDFQELGGGIVVRCAPGPLGDDFTGVDALQAAGFQPAGTAQYGLSFICRIAGKPALDQSLSIPGDPDYHEQCIDTPPPAAFWGYWYADDGGSWTYSQQGGASRDVVEGGFEGWSFSLNHPIGQAPPPGIAPQRPSRPPTTKPPTSKPPTSKPTHPTHPPTHRPTHHPTGHPTGRPPTHPPSSHPATSPRGNGTTGTAIPPTTPTSTPGSPGSSALASTTAARGTTKQPTGPTTTGTAADTPSTVAVSDPVAAGRNSAGVPVSGTLPGDGGNGGSGGMSAGTAFGIIAVAGLAAGGGIVAWRRRPHTE